MLISLVDKHLKITEFFFFFQVSSRVAATIERACNCGLSAYYNSTRIKKMLLLISLYKSEVCLDAREIPLLRNNHLSRAYKYVFFFFIPFIREYVYNSNFVVSLFPSFKCAEAHNEVLEFKYFAV